MKYLLHSSQLELLAQAAWSRVLLAFDFDGTLAPIVPRPQEAQMRTPTRETLAQACLLFPVAVISGRSRSDVASRLGDAPVKYVIGNHGLEPGAELAEAEAVLDEARRRLTALASRTPGLELEDKRYSLSVHYRRSTRKVAAQAAIQTAVDQLPFPLRTIPGKSVINILPPGSPNKGEALLALRRRENADTAIYVGDDATDEDVFRIDQPGRLLSVRVGRSSVSAAGYFLRDQREIDELLRRLVQARKDAAG